MTLKTCLVEHDKCKIFMICRAKIDMATEIEGRGHVVHLIHGIRTHAAWQDRVTAILEDVGGVRVFSTRYGKFDLLSFLLPGPTRLPPIKKTLKDLLDAARVAKSTGSKLTVIAHSYGTHAIHEILADNPAIDIDNLILCGAIKGQECNWQAIHRASVKGVLINDYGTRDIWPATAASITWGYGNGGTYGIGHPFEDRRHPFSHSDFFNDDFVKKFWLPFFQSGTVTPAAYHPYPNHPWWFRLLDLPWRWVIAAGLAVLCFWVALSLSPAGDFLHRPAETEISLGADGKPLTGFVYFEEQQGRSTEDGVFRVRGIATLPPYNSLERGVVMRATSTARVREEATKHSEYLGEFTAGQCARIEQKPSNPTPNLTTATSGGWVLVRAIKCPKAALAPSLSESPTPIPSLPIDTVSIRPNWTSVNDNWPRSLGEAEDFRRVRETVLRQCGGCLRLNDESTVALGGVSNTEGSRITVDARLCNSGIRFALQGFKLMQANNAPMAMTARYSTTDVKPGVITHIQIDDLANVKLAPIACL